MTEEETLRTESLMLLLWSSHMFAEDMGQLRVYQLIHSIIAGTVALAHGHVVAAQDALEVLVDLGLEIESRYLEIGPAQ